MTTPAEVSSRIDPLDIPNLNETQLYLYLRDEVGIPLGRNTVKRAVMSREIKPTAIAGKNLFSRSDGLNWITAQRNKAHT